VMRPTACSPCRLAVLLTLGISVLWAAPLAAQTESPAPPAAPADEPAVAPADAPDAPGEAAAPQAKPIDPQSFYHYALARDHEKAGRIDEAIAEYRKAAELDPTSTLILRDLASACLQKNDTAAAVEALQKAVEIDPSDVESLYRLARLAEQKDDLEEAEARYEQCLDAQGEAGRSRFRALALYRHARMLDTRRRFGEAAELFERLAEWLAEAPDDLRRDREVRQLIEQEQAILAKAIQLYFRANERAHAERVIRKTAATEPERLYNLGRWAQAEDRPDDAEAFYAKGLELTGDARNDRFYGLTFYRYARMLEEQGKVGDAAEVYRRLADWLKDVPETLRRDEEIGQLITQRDAVIDKVVRLHVQARHYEKAVGLIRESAAELIDRPGFAPLLVISLLNEKQADLAIEVAQLLQKRRPDDNASYRLLAKAYQQKGDDKAFVAAFRGFLKERPDRSVIKLLLAKGLLQTGKDDEAAGLIEDVVAQPAGLEEVGAEAIVPSIVNALLDARKADLALKVALAAQQRWPNVSSSYDLLSRVLDAAGDDAAFVETFRRLREAHPDVRAIPLLLGKKLLAMGRQEEGVGILEPLMSGDPAGAAEARQVLLEHYKTGGTPEQALKLYAQTISARSAPESLEPVAEDLARFVAGLPDPQAAMAAGRPVLAALNEGRDKTVGPDTVLGMLAEEFDASQAAECYQAAVDIKPDFIFGYQRRSAVLIGQDRLTEALSTLRAGTMRVSDRALTDRLLMTMGLICELLGRDADAIAHYTTAIRVNPEITRARYNLVRILHRLGRADEAKHVIDQTLIDRPRSSESYVTAAHYQAYLLGEWDKALAVMDRGLDELPDDRMLMYYKVPLLSRMKRYDEALRLCDDLMAEPRIENMVKSLRASVLVAKRDFKAAEKLIGELREAEPDDPEHQSLLAGLQAERGDEKAAVETLQGILAEHPRHTGANNDLGYMWADRGEKLARSERMIRRAVQETPGAAAYLDSLGWVLYKQNRMDEALVYLERSVRIDPEIDPLVWDHVGDTLARLGRREEARAAYEKAKQMLAKPDHRPGRDDDKLRKGLDKKLEALRKEKTVPVAPLGIGFKE